MKLRLLVLFTAALLVSNVAYAGQVHKWTDRNGKQLDAEFVRVFAGDLVLLQDGQVVSYPLRDFSATDIQFVRDELTARGQAHLLPEIDVAATLTPTPTQQPSGGFGTPAIAAPAASTPPDTTVASVAPYDYSAPSAETYGSQPSAGTPDPRSQAVLQALFASNSSQPSSEPQYSQPAPSYTPSYSSSSYSSESDSDSSSSGFRIRGNTIKGIGMLICAICGGVGAICRKLFGSGDSN